MERTTREIEAVWRIESARVIASLARTTGDVGLAEDLAHDALVAALEQWPGSGMPDKPGAWLVAVAKRRAIDRYRRDERLAHKVAVLGGGLQPDQGFEAEIVEEIDDDIGDDLLRLVFTACHPALSPESRVALTLRLVGGLTTEEIAHAYLVPPATIAQRIVRAKQTLAREEIPYEVPSGDELPNRLGSVLEVIYAIFNEGYTATTGEHWTRPTLCEEALRLGRILATLMPSEPEVHGLVALMEIQASRLRARSGPDGRPVLLFDQDRARWDRLLINRGLVALERSETLSTSPGPYTIQASIAACHARAMTPDETDWVRIAGLYDELARLVPSPVVQLNRAVAVGMAIGPEAGLELVDSLTKDPAMGGYHLLFSVRGDLLSRLGRTHEARAEFARAAQLVRNIPERELLLERAGPS